MKNKNTDFQRALNKKIEQSRIENARREARNIHNYNKWKSNHDRLVQKELRKLERKSSFPSFLKVIVVLMVITYILYKINVYVPLIV